MNLIEDNLDFQKNQIYLENQDSSSNTQENCAVQQQEDSQCSSDTELNYSCKEYESINKKQKINSQVSKVVKFDIKSKVEIQKQQFSSQVVLEKKKIVAEKIEKNINNNNSNMGLCQQQLIIQQQYVRQQQILMKQQQKYLDLLIAQNLLLKDLSSEPKKVKKNKKQVKFQEKQSQKYVY